MGIQSFQSVAKPLDFVKERFILLYSCDRLNEEDAMSNAVIAEKTMVI